MPRRRQPDSPLNRACRAAVVGLLLAGQLLAGTAVPVPGDSASSVCGCPSEDHRAGVCCCAAHGQAPGSCCPAPAVDPEPEAEPACPKCKTKAVPPKAEPSPVRWVVARMVQRCRGFDPATPLDQEPATAPPATIACAVEQPCEPRAIAFDPASDPVSSPPPTPPPRPA